MDDDFDKADHVLVETGNTMKDTGQAPGAGTGISTGAGGKSGESRPRLRRSRTDKWLGGVCGGLGHYFGVDPIIFRIAFVVLCFAGGTGLVLYLVSWVLVPAEDRDVSPAQELLSGQRDWRKIGAIVLIVLGALSLLSELDFGRWGGVVWGVVLLGFGIALLSSCSSPGGPSSLLPNGSSTTSPPAGPTGITETFPERYGEGGGGKAAPAATLTGGALAGEGGSASGNDATGADGADRQRQSFAPVVFSLLLIIGGLAALLDASGAVDVSLLVFLSLALLAIGVCLVIGTWWGRARGLITVGVLLTVVIAVLSVIDVPLRGGFGERDWRPISRVRVEDEYRLAMGELTLDLSEVSFGESVTEVDASVGLGQLTVLVPSDVDVTVDARTTMGELDVFDRREGGVGVAFQAKEASIAGSDGGRLVLRLAVGLGQVEVHREAS